ncbi:MAG: hypothetical protein JST75_09260 [Bacteroidetes bacterium]|nr:hypothetical protein [Bacteroidota bacterium]
MATPVKKPWAILLCKFSDDPNDPSVTTVKDLAAQWRATASPEFIAGNLDATWDTDNRTILDLYELFFTTTGIFTNNIVDYFFTVCHQLVDVTGNQVFPITLPMTIAEGAAKALNPGGAAYQDMIFQKAKAELQNSYGVDWKDFYGVAVSFQSADNGSQGGIFDGGPGVFMDIRFVKSQGAARWGHEMGHGFGLDHSRTNLQNWSFCTGGAPNDYTDPYDVMSWNCNNKFADPNYGTSGPGMNAWNMRLMGGLDESRVWKSGSASAVSSRITLRPLHNLSSPGYLAAELPGIDGDSNYLVEFRVPQYWDAGIGGAGVIVHRYAQDNSRSFPNVNSYIMKGTNDQKLLGVGDVFEKGTGPFSRVKVVSIDAAAQTAVVALCYTPDAVTVPKVTIAFGAGISLDPCTTKVPVAGTIGAFSFKMTGLVCKKNYTVMWSVDGANTVAGQLNSQNTFSIVTPDPSVKVTVFITITFDDGMVITDSLSFNPITDQMAGWLYFICNLSHERLKPIPWWQWDPEKFRQIFSQYSRAEREHIAQAAEKILNAIKNAGGYLK